MSDKKNERRGLGRGLSALMADVTPATPASDGGDRSRRPDMMMPVERIRPNPDQPRRDFAPEQLNELAESIRAKGVIQPLIVRPDPGHEGDFQIVAGERRWRAAQLAKLHELPVLVRDFTDTEVLEVAIIENIQRADLNPVEEAMAYRQLMERFGHTQEKLAEGLAKSRSHIANSMRLLQLPDEVLTFLREGKLTAGHARALITTENAAELARKIISKGLSVREAERLAKAPTAKPAAKKAASEKDADTRALEQDLSANLKMKVDIDHNAAAGDGRLVLHYRTLEDLDELCRVLTASPLSTGR